MTAEQGRAVVYALGGGSGHARRAAQIAARFDSAVVLHQAPQPPRTSAATAWIQVTPAWTAPQVRAWLAASASRASTLIVDTFPAGPGHELDNETLAQFHRTVFVRRYMRTERYQDYHRLADRYGECWLPYDEDACEWHGEAQGSYVGPLVRTLTVADRGSVPVAILGPSLALPPAWLAVIPPGSLWLDRPFSMLPRARRYLSVGAGHNVSYELRAAGVPVACVPLQRRYDDQFRRADMLGTGVHTRRDLTRFLGGACASG